MNEVTVRIDNWDKARHFIHLAERCDFKIEIFDGNMHVVAKSLIGVMNLHFSKPWDVSYEGYDQHLEGFLAEHRI